MDGLDIIPVGGIREPKGFAEGLLRVWGAPVGLDGAAKGLDKVLGVLGLDELATILESVGADAVLVGLVGGSLLGIGLVRSTGVPLVEDQTGGVLLGLALIPPPAPEEAAGVVGADAGGAAGAVPAEVGRPAGVAPADVVGPVGLVLVDVCGATGVAPADIGEAAG